VVSIINIEKLIEQYQTSARSSVGDAQSLPFAVYTDQAIAEIERERIFGSSWVFACAEANISKPGDYYAINVFGESIALIRGKDQIVRAISNICRHRGTPILNEGFGNVKTLVCPYHAWTYNHEGQLMGAPFSDSAEIDKTSLCLPTFYTEIWRGLVFVSFEEQPSPVNARLQGLNNILDLVGADQFFNVGVGSVDHWNTNWKLAMENAMESYHLFKVHSETLETVTPTKQSFYLEGTNNWSLTAGRMNGLDGALSKWLAGDKHELYSHYFLIMLPPNFVGILTCESFDWISVIPSVDGGCVVQSESLAKSKLDSNTQTHAFVDQFFAEDKEICERVYRGMTSRRSSGGPLLEVERIVVDFHRYLARQLFAIDCKTEYRSDSMNKFS